jgi:hypothetical protein
MSETTTQQDRPAQHPLIYTAEEARVYLRLESVDQLEVYRREYGLTGFRPVGKGYSYWREDLDAAAAKAFGRKEVENRTQGRQLRLAGGGR